MEVPMRRALRVVPAVLLLASIASLTLHRGAETVPLYAARTGNLCQQCHFDPNGGGPRNDYGFAFARNRHSLEADPDTTSMWHDLDLTNRVGEKMPLYIGANQRFMLLSNNTKTIKGADRLGFFNMENAIHFAFQPHPRLTLVYSFDAFSEGPANAAQNRDAFGMIGGLPMNGYIKAGRFRNPFGLRLDDHTVATRHSFLDFGNGESFLPYDPRYPDMGIEIGAERAPFFGRASFTNGESDVFAGEFAETKAIKLGYNNAHYQGAVSFYDDYQKQVHPPYKRQTRWGYYALTHYGPFAFVGEIAAGTDEGEPVVPGHASGPKTNRLAGYGEVDYAPTRWLNTRVRYDYLQYDRSSDPLVRDANTHTRYALEADWVPVPFAELRATVRRIDHKNAVAYGSEDETQGYLQFHFSY
jgi:hypothetical protein